MTKRAVVAAGHRTDNPDRQVPRFPESRVDAVANEMASIVAEWQVDSSAVLICGGARGADLIAAEQALARGASVMLHLALPAEEFIERSIRLEGTDWVARFRAVAERATIEVLPADYRANRTELFANTNRWMLDTASSLDPDFRAVIVWNGQAGEGTGGAADMVGMLRSRGVATPERVRVIDPTPRAYENKQDLQRPKRILALDGGGMRGVLTLEVLAEIERQLREAYGNPAMVLADYFDYLAGTSTGAIIAAALALGSPTSVISHKYVDLGATVFRKRPLPMRWWSLYRDQTLREKVDDFLGPGRTLGDPDLRTLLLIVMHNTATDSPWLLSNCTRAKYNRTDRLLLEPPDRNLDLPLTSVIRGSSAAPFYFPAERLQVGSRDFYFQDGGITPYNNPALLAFTMATMPEMGVRWRPGAEEILVVSVGTGTSASVHPRLRRRAMHGLFNARNLPAVFMNGASFGQDWLCRALGQCRYGPVLDREVGDRVEQPSVAGSPLFSYVRYNADLEESALISAGFAGPRERARLRKLDAVSEVPALRRLGRLVAANVDIRRHFADFLQ